MNDKSKHDILRESPLFDNLLTAELSMLSDLFEARCFSDEEFVFREGDVGDSMYVVADGIVEILRKGPDGNFQAFAELQAPQFFGEMSLIDKEYRSVTAKAKGNVQLLQLSNENLHQFARAYRNGFTWVVVNIARVLSARLRETNRRLAENL